MAASPFASAPLRTLSDSQDALGLGKELISVLDHRLDIFARESRLGAVIAQRTQVEGIEQQLWNFASTTPAFAKSSPNAACTPLCFRKRRPRSTNSAAAA
jgi:hypothetical protein